MAHRLLACELQLLLDTQSSFSSWAGDVVGPEQVIQHELSSQQKVRLHSKSARLTRQLLASQQSIHLITAITRLYHAPCGSHGAIVASFDSSSKYVSSQNLHGTRAFQHNAMQVVPPVQPHAMWLNAFLTFLKLGTASREAHFGHPESVHRRLPASADDVQVHGRPRVNHGASLQRCGHKPCLSNHHKPHEQVDHEYHWHTGAQNAASEGTIFSKGIERAAEGLHGPCMQALAVAQRKCS